MYVPLPDDENVYSCPLEALAIVVGALPDGAILVDAEGKTALANKVTEALFGFDQAELVGRPVEMLIPKRFELLHAEHRARYTANPQARPIDTGPDFVGRRKDGGEFSVDITLSTVQSDRGPYTLTIVRDLSERSRAQELHAKVVDLERRFNEQTADLQTSEARYRALFHSVDEGFCIIGMIFDDQEKPVDYRFLDINPAFERHTGLVDAVGKRMRELAPEHEEHWFEIYGRVALEGEPVRFQNSAEQLSRFYDVYAFRIGEPAARQVAILFNDITEKHNMELAIVEAKDRAERANQAKSEFLSRMSHELRTPMNSVLGYAQLLDMRYEDPQVKDAAQCILKGGRHLLEMINEVLDLSRIETGNLAMSIEPVMLSEIVSQAVGLVQPLADSAGIQIIVVSDAKAELHLQADRQRLLQIVINLLSNGIKYNARGGRVVLRSLAPVNGRCRIEISDTGPGISADDQEQLFQPFQRFGDSGVEGTGLGLALSQRLATLMDGVLGLAESSPQGSTFYIEMNTVVPAYQEAKSNGAMAASSWGGKNLRGTVVYIEDNLSNLRLLETALSDCTDLKLVPAMQGAIGIDLAREHQPDLILLDVHLPDIMGDKVLERLRADSATKSIPVVVLSADATRVQIKHLLACGAEEYLTKPLDLAKLFEVLAQYLGA